jgi:hypothetical protein
MRVNASHDLFADGFVGFPGFGLREQSVPPLQSDMSNPAMSAARSRASSGDKGKDPTTDALRTERHDHSSDAPQLPLIILPRGLF